MVKSYPAKILLFGEYTILNGSKALAIPYEKFQGRWSYSSLDDHDSQNSHEILRSYLEHGPELYIDRERLARDVERGLWFDSTIPHGFGLGSSGSLVAAVYDSYGKKRGNLIEDKRALARLEDYFHGASSGLDPLVSLIQDPLLIHSFEEVEILKSKLNLANFFLVNTGKPRQTGPLVSIYKDKLKDPQFKQGCAEILSKEVNFAIEALLKNDRSNIFHHLWLISKFQWEFFPEMIPTQMRGPWSKGLETGDYVLKLCGAGGGGFILGYSDKFNATDMKRVFDPHELWEL